MDLRNEFSLEHYQAVSQEIAMVDRFREISADVRDSLLNFMNTARAFVKKKFGPNEDLTIREFSSYRDQGGHRLVERYLSEVTYSNTRELTAFIPPAFIGNMTEYLDVLNDGKQYFTNLERDTLNPAKAYIAKLITDPNALNGAGAFRLTADRAEKWAEALAVFHGDNIATDMALFGDLFKSNTQYLDSYAKAKVLNSYSKDITAVQSVRNASNDLVGLFDRLIVRIEANPGQYRVNGNNAQSLTDLAYALARDVELYSVFITSANSALIAMERTEERLIKIAKK